ncbi:MAG: helix-turn-helix domain-containing protein [Nitrospinae bacterium]|nr:helix-turn-helix domain-containing protein [Nitrospinota bacterium]
MKPADVRTLDHYALLNLPYSARQDEVERAYMHLTSVYAENSRACCGAISEVEREWIARRIQEAYDTLTDAARRAEYDATMRESGDHGRIGPKAASGPDGSHAEHQPARVEGGNGAVSRRKEPTVNPAFTSGAISGSHLRNIRLARGASLDEISAMTKVKKAYLEAIESENFKSFPAPVFLKGFLKAYAKALGLDPEEISSKYNAGG